VSKLTVQTKKIDFGFLFLAVFLHSVLAFCFSIVSLELENYIPLIFYVSLLTFFLIKNHWETKKVDKFKHDIEKLTNKFEILYKQLNGVKKEHPQVNYKEIEDLMEEFYYGCLRTYKNNPTSFNQNKKDLIVHKLNTIQRQINVVFLSTVERNQNK